MADVRLTATNPDDSTVVPVACNEKGELKLEELPDQSFDGNLDGNLSVTGTGTFDHDVSVGYGLSGTGCTLNDSGQLFVQSKSTAIQIQDANNNNVNAVLVSNDGSAQFVTGQVVFRKIESQQDRRFAVFGTEGEVQFQYSRYSADNGTFSVIVPNTETSGGFPCFVVNDTSTDLFRVNQNGSAIFQGSGTFKGDLVVTSIANGAAIYPDGGATFAGNKLSINGGTGTLQVNSKAFIFAETGGAEFNGDVVVGSRNKKWMIVESNGLAHLVEQTRAADISTADLVNPDNAVNSVEYPPLRDIPGELTMVEQQLQKVMERLKMAPEAGWEVWDGSD